MTLKLGKYNISQEEKNKINEDLGSPIWCIALNKYHLVDLRKELAKHYSKRQDTLLGNRPFILPTGINKETFDIINNYFKYFYIDEECICRSLLTDKDQEYAFRLGDMLGAIGKAGIPYYFRGPDQMFILKSIKSEPRRYLSLRVRKLTPEVKITNPSLNYIDLYNKKVGEETKIYLTAGGDNFSNQTNMHLILNSILKDSVNYVYQYDAFYCKDIGYNITELANGGDLSYFLEKTKINDEILFDILKQISEPLIILKTDAFGFVHADLKAKNVFVNVPRDKKGIITGPPQFKIADYDKSSITYKGIRFYNDTFDYKVFGKPLTGQRVPFKLKETENQLYYKLSDYDTSWLSLAKVLPIQLYTMHNPSGFYMSYDIYTFFYSLMMEPSVWSYVQSTIKDKKKSRFMDAWHRLWFKDDYPIVMKEIKSSHDILESTEDKKKQLSDMRSIRIIANTLSKLNVRLKYNLDEYYGILNLKMRDTDEYLNIPRKSIIKITKDGHICLDPPEEKSGFLSKYYWCKTNSYAKKGKNWDWDYYEP